MERYLDGEELPPDELNAAHPARDHRGQARPGRLRLRVQEQGRAADAGRRRAYLPCPLDIAAIAGLDPTSTTRPSGSSDPNAPFSGLAFKVATDPHLAS